MPLLFKLKFDFNPLNLRSPHVESVSTFLELRKDPDLGVNAIEILKSSQAEAAETATKLAALPETLRTMTLQNFVPDGQQEKLGMVRNAARALEPALNPRRISPRPSDAENIGALNATADQLTQAAGTEKGPGAEAAKRLAGLLSQARESRSFAPHQGGKRHDQIADNRPGSAASGSARTACHVADAA